MSTAETSVIASELGRPIPYLPHAISASLPTWRDTLNNARGEPRVVEAMTAGYPRSFIHRSIQLLARICEENFGIPGESCMLVSSAKLADAGRSYLLRHSPTPIPVRVAHHTLPPSTLGKGASADTQNDFLKEQNQSPNQLNQLIIRNVNQQLSRRQRRVSSKPNPNHAVDSVRRATPPYAEARHVLQRRIVQALKGDFSSHGETFPLSIPPKNGSASQTLSDDDVFLYPGGMNAIWHAHQLILQTAEQMGKVAGKSICFGFPYTCTLKVLQKWGPGCHFFGSGVDEDLSEVRRVAREATASGVPVLALFCEVCTNPLLRTPNLVELRTIADEFDFLIVVDETIGNFVNVDVMGYADIVVTSLTKVFSGRANVMGGSLVLNPQRRCHGVLRDHLKAIYEDLFWHEDGVCMELNSRHFARRIDVINRNAEVIADWLCHQSEVHNATQLESRTHGGKKRVITNVFYPKWVTRKNYGTCRRRPASSAVAPRHASGFGGLLTILFCNEPAARAFYDNLGCEKGPTCGTSFTLACPYTIIAHSREVDWAAQYGVPINIVRISIGMEDPETILGWMKHALETAERASRL